MRILSLLAMVLAGLTFSACSSTDWVHPNKPSDEFTSDYNKCQNLVMRDPKLQQGSQLLILNAGTLPAERRLAFDRAVIAAPIPAYPPS